MLGLSFPRSKIIYLTSIKDGFDRGRLLKNGFTDAFLLPFESANFEKYILEFLSRSADTHPQNFRAVKLIDFRSDEPLEFDTYVYMPLNNKFVRLSVAGRGILPEQLKRFKLKELNELYINLDDLPKFYQFTAQQLVQAGQSETLSETEKQEKFQKSIRTLVGGVFADSTDGKGFAPGRKILDDCKEIVKSYIQDFGKQASLYDRIAALSRNNDDHYSSAMNVSTLGALLSMGLQIGDPEEVAIAGLLRDVGIAELPIEIQSIPRDSLEANQLKKYMEHPKHSLKILKEKRLLLSERVNDMIVQHHEHFDGTGFPDGKVGRKIVPEAQILAIAEELDDILAIVEGRPRSSPKRAIEMVVQNEAGYPLGHRYDPALLRRVVSLLFGTP